MSARDLDPPDSVLAASAGMRRLARALARDAFEADDLVQDAWLRALQHRPWVKNDEVRPWMARVVRNLASLARVREAHRRERERLAARAEGQPSSAELLERAELHHALVAAVMRIREPFREAVLLRYLESLPPRRIARRLGVPVSTVNARLARGLSLLRERLDGSPEGRASLRSLALLARPLLPLRLLPGGLLVALNSKLAIAALALGALLLSLLVVRGTDSDARAPDGLDVATTTGVRPKTPGARAGAARAAASTAKLAVPVASAPPATELNGRLLGPDGSPLPGIEVGLLYQTASESLFLDPIPESPEPVIDRSTTGADGVFRFEVEPDRPHVLRAPAGTHSFYAQFEQRGCYGGQFVTLQLATAGALFGRVLERDGGAAVSGARVSLMDDADPQALRRVAETSSDSQGIYRFDGLSRGFFAIEVVPPGLQLSSRIAFALGEGQRKELDFALAPGFLLTGTITAAGTGLPIAGARVAEGWRFLREVTTDEHGRYELFGAGEESMIYALAPGFGRREASLPAPRDGVAQLDFELGAGRSVSGRVLGPDGAPLAGVYVAAAGSDFGGSIQRTDWPSTRTDAQGRFELRELRADLRHALVLRKSGSGTLVYAFPGDETELDRIEFGELHMAAASGIRGVVLESNGDRAPGVGLMLHGYNRDIEAHGHVDLPGLDSYLRKRTAWSDADGRFHFADLGPGEYVVQVLREGRPDLPSQAVRCEAGVLVDEIELRFAAGGRIAGRALDPAGAPVGGLWLFLHGGPEPNAVPLRWRTALDGGFEFAGLEPGTYSLRSKRSSTSPGGVAPARRRLVATLNDIPADATDLELIVPYSDPIVGVVREEDGVPAPHFFVSAYDVRGKRIGHTRADEAGRFEVDAPEGETVELRVGRIVPGATAGSFRSITDPASEVRLSGVRAGSRGIELRLPAWP